MTAIPPAQRLGQLHALTAYEVAHPLIIDDRGQQYTIPRRRIGSVTAEVAERWVANVAVPRAVVDRLIDCDLLEPEPHAGEWIVSLCMIAIRHAAPDWAPLKLGPASRNAALRVACRDRRTGEPAVWVDRRWSDCALVEALAKLNFPAVHAGLRCDLERDYAIIAAPDRQFECRLTYDPGIANYDALFADAAAFQDYFSAGVRSFGPGRTAGRCAVVDLHKHSDNQFERRVGWRGTLHIEGETWVCRSVYRTVHGRYQWRYQGEVDAAAWNHHHPQQGA